MYTYARVCTMGKGVETLQGPALAGQFPALSLPGLPVALTQVAPAPESVPSSQGPDGQPVLVTSAPFPKF